MTHDSVPHSAIDVRLDGHSVAVPSERQSLGGICAFLEAMALRQERILCSLVVDGEPINLTQPPTSVKSFASIEAETMGLNEVPVQLIRAALQQTIFVREQVQSAVEMVLINEEQAQEMWWNLSLALKEPLLTLSLLPEGICGPSNGQASLMQLRKWQLQQLGEIIQNVNNASEWENATMLSDALELRVLPWLEKLQASLELWQQTILSGVQAHRRSVA